ncbi:MAG TPA: hypothetical protein VNO70_02935 [Blastocatellia bacterium]|nr:hypothetical protein [Blastocatellia bacterium]
MSGESNLLALETTLKQLNDFCRNAENQLRPLMAQFEECRDAREGVSDKLDYLFDRAQSKGFGLLSDVMEMKIRIRELRDYLDESMLAGE